MAPKNETILNPPQKVCAEPTPCSLRLHSSSSCISLLNVRRCHWAMPSRFPRAAKKSLQIFSRSVFDPFLREKVYELFHPPEIVMGAIRRDPVFLRAPPIGLPKRSLLFRIVAVHGHTVKWFWVRIVERKRELMLGRRKI